MFGYFISGCYGSNLYTDCKKETSIREQLATYTFLQLDVVRIQIYISKIQGKQRNVGCKQLKLTN